MDIKELAKRIVLDPDEKLAIRDLSIESGRPESECEEIWREGAAKGWLIESEIDIEEILFKISKRHA